MATTQRPQLSALKTPLSATYPSELRSPLVATPTFIKQEESQKTPITPPAAYLDFLSKLSPTVMSPVSGGGPARFHFPEKPTLPSNASSESVTTTASSTSYTSTATAGTAATESSRPASPQSNTSSRSSSCSSCSHESIDHKPEPINTKAIMPPQSPFARPASARTPRRLLIPQSPYSPGSVRSPLSAGGMYSPYSAAMSPREPFDPEKSGRTTAVSVRSVVTRTVTYASSARTPMVEPVPANKKRRTEGPEA